MFTNDRVLEVELKEIFEKIKEIYKLSQEGNSDSQTFIFFLKYTLQNTIKHYDPTKSAIFSTREIYGLVLNILEEVIFFSTQVVQIPKSTKTSNQNLINEKLKKYVTHSEILKYKHFKQGLIDDHNSAHFLIFYSKINDRSNSLLSRSAFQIFESISAIKKILFLAQIYAPLELKLKNNNPIFGGEYHTLYLIGFKISTTLTFEDGSTKKIVDVTYTNPSDFERFVSSLNFESIMKFKDTYIENSGFLLNKATKMNQKDIETFTLQFELDYLKEQFENNKSIIKTKLK